MSAQLEQATSRCITSSLEFRVFTTAMTTRPELHSAIFGLFHILRHGMVTWTSRNLENIISYLSQSSEDETPAVNRLVSLRAKHKEALKREDIQNLIACEDPPSLDEHEASLQVVIIGERLIHQMKSLDGESFNSEAAEAEVSLMLIHVALANLKDADGNEILLGLLRWKVQGVRAFEEQEAESRRRELQEAPKVLLNTGRPTLAYRRTINIILTLLAGEDPSDLEYSEAVQEIVTTGMITNSITAPCWSASQKALIAVWAASHLRTATQGNPECPDTVAIIAKSLAEGKKIEAAETVYFGLFWPSTGYYSRVRPPRKASRPAEEIILEDGDRSSRSVRPRVQTNAGPPLPGPQEALTDEKNNQEDSRRGSTFRRNRY